MISQEYRQLWLRWIYWALMAAAGLLASVPTVAAGQDAGIVRQVRLEESRLRSTQAKLQQAFVASPEWTSAQDELRMARQHLEEVRRTALAPLWATPQYRALWNTKQAVESQIDQLHRDEKAPPQKTLSLAAELLRLRQALSRAEAAALQSDPGSEAARDRLVQAATRVETLTSQQRQTLRSDGQVFASCKRLQEARTRMVAAAAARDRAIAQAEIRKPIDLPVRSLQRSGARSAPRQGLRRRP